MPRLTEAFFKRVFKASRDEGVAVIEIEDGKTIVLAGKTDKAGGSESLTPLEEWRKKKGRGQG